MHTATENYSSPTPYSWKFCYKEITLTCFPNKSVGMLLKILKFLLVKLILNSPEAVSKRYSLTLTGWCLTNDHTYLNKPAAKSYRFAEEYMV